MLKINRIMTIKHQNLSMYFKINEFKLLTMYCLKKMINVNKIKVAVMIRIFNFPLSFAFLYLAKNQEINKKYYIILI